MMLVIKLIKMCFKILVSLCVVGVLVWMLSCTNFGKVSDVAKDIRQTVTQTFAPEIEALKETASTQAQKIAQQLDVDAEDVESFLKKYHIEGLEPCDLPAGVTERKTITTTVMGNKTTLTFYQGDEYLTITTGGKDVTLKVSADKKKYIGVLERL